MVVMLLFTSYDGAETDELRDETADCLVHMHCVMWFGSEST
jgi:hypothetical protein